MAVCFRQFFKLSAKTSVATVILFAVVIYGLLFVKLKNQDVEFKRALFVSGNELPQETRQHLSTEECEKTLTCLTEGSWVLREGTSKEDHKRRRELEQEVHEYLGFPRILHREDGRCGENVTAPGSTKLGALCDSVSATPCCNENSGTCGSGRDYCACEMCTDFSRYLDAESAQWVPSSKRCKFKVFDQTLACDLLDSSLNELVFIGDSITRHFFTAMAILLTGNKETGSHKMDTKLHEKCKGEYQFIDNGKFDCQLAIAHAWDDLDRTQVCGGRAHFKFSLVEAYYSPVEAHKTVRGLLNKTGSVIVVNVGLHMKRNPRIVIKRYLGPLLDMIEEKGNGWPRVIWHNLHSVNNFLRSSTIKTFHPWRVYNDKMAEYCRSRGVPVLDFYPMTTGIKSLDGLHFGYGGNLQKAQVLLNFIKHWTNQCREYKK